MTASRLRAFMDQAGDRPYRKLIEHHLRRQSESQLHAASLGEIAQLPEDMRGSAAVFIDVINERHAFDEQFWRAATCRDAYDRFIELAVDVFDRRQLTGSAGDPLWLQDEELAFHLFQIPTLVFAYSASTQRQQRRFMGIRKGLFG